MFRNFNLYRQPVEDKIVIYKNIRHRLGVINAEWIDKIVYKHKDISQFNLTIPQYVMNKGVKKYNSIYNNVFSGQFIIINDTEKYVLREKQGNVFKKDGKKIFTCYSYEKTFENKRISIDSGNYQLVSNDVVVTKGILETVLDYTRYKIGKVDHDAMYQLQMAEDTETLELYKDYIKENVQYEQLLWEKDFNIDIGDNPLYININYLNIKTTNNGTVVKDGEKVYTAFTDAFYTGIKHIKCYYVTEEANRWACKYVITLKDNEIQEFIYPFTNITGYNVEFDVELTYGLGTYTEQELIKLPYFDTIDDSILNVLRDIEEAFDCTLDFDHINRVINVIANKNVGITKGTLLSFDTNVLELNMEEDSVIPSALKVIGKDNLSISSENIFGGDMIYNYDYYMKFMSKECKSAWERYIELITIKKEEFRMLKDNRQILNNRLIRLDSEIKALEKKIAYTKSLLSTFVAQEDKDNQSTTKAELDELEAKFNELQRNRNDLKSQIQRYDDDILVIAEALNKETAKDGQGKIFTDDDLDELDSYTVVESLEDDYYTVPSALYLESERILKDKVIPKYEWKLKSTDITKVSSNWRKDITLGDLFKTEGKVRSSIGEDRVRLVEFTYIPSKKQITSLEFTNKDKKDDVLKKYANSGRKVSGNNNVINSWNQIIQDAMLSNNLVKSLVDNGLDLATMQVNGRSVKNILDIGSYGIYVNDTESDNTLYLGSNLLAISKDRFKTSEIAISTEGINARLLISSIILGEKLCITSEDNLFYIGVTDEEKEGFGLKICDSVDLANPKERVFLGLERDSDGVRRAKLRLMSKDGQTLVLSEEGMLQTNQMCDERELDSSHPLTIDLYVDEGVNRVDTAKLLLKCKRFRSTTRGSRLVSKVGIVRSGGGSTSGGGGGGTSSHNGKHDHMMFAESNNYLPTESLEFPKTFDCRNLNGDLFPVGIYANRKTALWTYGSADNHFHYSDYHYHSTPDHTHPDIDISHQHEEIWGINEDTLASNLVVWVNGNKITQGLNGVSEINIASKLIKGQWNEIKIESFTNGAVAWCLFTKTFNLF